MAASAEKQNLAGFVGFANLPNQVHRRSVKKGFQFTLLAVGESGLGKATLVNTLFGTEVIPARPANPPPGAEPASTVTIKTHLADIEENGVRLRVNVLESVGFGDFINNDASWKPIVQAIEERFDTFLDQERRVNRKGMVDYRIHCCLYFVSPTGHGLRPLDIELMKQVHSKVNLIPVIAKADTLTREELVAFKKRILDDMAFHKIRTFVVETDASDDPETIATAKDLMSKVPFAVIGSTQEYEVSGKKVRGRKYPWGVIEVENEDHCDFAKLRQLLIRTHMEDLVSHTNEVLYEQYRTAKLLSVNGNSASDGGNPLTRFEEERKLLEQRLKEKEDMMRAVFQSKVQEREAKLNAAQEKMRAEHAELKKKLEAEKLELEEKKRQLEEARSPEKKTKKRSGIF
jgi:septin 7